MEGAFQRNISVCELRAAHLDGIDGFPVTGAVRVRRGANCCSRTGFVPEGENRCAEGIRYPHGKFQFVEDYLFAKGGVDAADQAEGEVALARWDRNISLSTLCGIVWLIGAAVTVQPSDRLARAGKGGSVDIDKGEAVFIGKDFHRGAGVANDRKAPQKIGVRCVDHYIA